MNVFLMPLALSLCRQMGRDVTVFRTDKKSTTVNDKSNVVIRTAPKALPEKSEVRDCETNDHNLIARIPNEFIEKQDVLGVKSTNHQPEEKIIKAEDQKSTDKKVIMPAKPASGSSADGTIDANSFGSSKSGLEDDKPNSHANHANGAGDNDSEILPKSSDHSPMSVKKSQVSMCDRLLALYVIINFIQLIPRGGCLHLN